MNYCGDIISGDLIKEARKRAGLTQIELGTRLGKSQSAIARWERDDVQPSLETLREIVRGCGLDFTFFMSTIDDSNVTIIDDHLNMTSRERFADMMTRIRFREHRERRATRDATHYQPDVMLEVLERHHVPYVVIGDFAAELRGSPYVISDVDITPARSRENLERLSTSLVELEAKLRVPNLDYPLDIPLNGQTFDQGTTWTFVTRFGYLDVDLLPDGTRGYEDLKRDATIEELTDSLSISVASLADVIRSKEAAGREKDRAVLPILRQVLERSRDRERYPPEVDP